MESNNKLADHQSHHVPVQYIQGNQSGSANGSRSPNDRKCKPVDNNSLQVKSRENKNPNNKENHGGINSTSKKEIIIVGDSMIKHVTGREVSRDDSIKIRCHPGATTDDHHSRNLIWSLFIPVLMTFKIRLTHFKKLERSLLPLKKSMLTMKEKLLFQMSFTAMIKTSRKILKKSTESWRIYVRVKGLSSLIIVI